MGIFVGVDLGTTYSVVAIKDTEINYIVDESGQRLVPSVITYCEDGSVKFYGREAVENEDDFPEQTIRSSKRYIGQNVKSLIDIENFKEITPKDVARDILKYLKYLTESKLQEDLEGVVITVPAYFNQNQRHETKQAAEESGLNVLRIINEPTAAALAYGDLAKTNELVLIYDLGGGTFDVTVLTLTDDNLYQVLSTSGDTKLGGDDFDNIIVEQIKSELPIDLKPFSDFKVRLKQFSEQVKISLNYRNTINKTLKYCGTINGKIYHHKFNYTKDQYIESILPLLSKTKSHVLNALNDANKKISNLDKIILVGGSTKSKFVRDYVKENFNTNVYYNIDPDLTVATGAANLAKSLYEKSSDDVILIDVTPLSLGIETKGGLFNKVINRNTSIPFSGVKDYSTSYDNQDTVTIRIYQGERPLVQDNYFLGEFELSGFPRRPKGQTIIVVKFDIDSSGLITVTAFDKTTGENAQVVLKSLTSLEAEAKLDDVEYNSKNDLKILQMVELENLQLQAETLILKKILKGEDAKELRESFDACKDQFEHLCIFVQSLKD